MITCTQRFFVHSFEGRELFTQKDPPKLLKHNHPPPTVRVQNMDTATRGGLQKRRYFPKKETKPKQKYKALWCIVHNC